MLTRGGDDPVRLGPYRVRAVIGDGGMGRVYLATSPAGRAVAVKVIRPGLANEPGFRERFAREARAAMSVSGVYTASVVDSDTAGELPYLATEYVPSPSLNEVVQSTGPLGETTVRALGAGLAEALAAIHRAGLVHRDLKPHNVLLAQNGPVVIDFGIARMDVETALTAVGSTVGTPGYIAPEVLHGQAPSAASDVFSLGCVLVFAARGIGPYGHGDPLVVTYRSAHEEPDLSDLPDPIRLLVVPALNRDPARRPTPAQMLGEATRTGDVTLHDGLWLPDEVRTMLDSRRREVQELLRDGADATGASGADGPGTGAAGAGAAGSAGAVGVAGAGAAGAAGAVWQPQAPAPAAQTAIPFQAPAPTPASPPASPPSTATPTGAWRAAAPTEPGFHPDGPTPTPGNGLAGPASNPPAPTQRRRLGFAYATAGAAVAVIVVVALVVLLTNRSPLSSPTAAGSTNASATATAAASTAAASTTPTSAASTASTTAAADTASVLNYRPGTYKVNQVAATDLLGNTATVASVTVASDHTVSVKLVYTNNSGFATQWTCDGSAVGEATLQTASGGKTASTGSDCTKDPSETWNMPAGGTVDSVEYFASAPPGTGAWTFAINSSSEFVGSTQAFTIPTS